MQDKPIDSMDPVNGEEKALVQSKDEEQLAQRVQQLFRSAWDAKQQLGLVGKWRKCDDYKHGRQNPRQSEEHPGSVTNIVHPIVESQISDLIAKPYGVTAKGWEPSDDMFAEQAQNMLEFVLYRNQFKTKLHTSEHDRLELGTSIFKVWFDPDDYDGKGIPKFETVSPANFFPDPKVTMAERLQDAEFIIHAVPRPLSWFRDRFEDRGKYVVREVSVPYDPEQTFEDAGSDESSAIASQKALLIECYMRDAKGKLYCIHVANNIVLEDSRKVLKDKKLQRRDQYPFVMIPCYIQRGTAWGQGDVELLIPTQDLINELDDQIRMNARLAGNPQKVVGQAAGKRFDPRLWTNKPGLTIPMRDHHAWTIVPPQNVSSDVTARREKAFSEADLISGRPDVSRGEKPGGITAASAIMALQQAGQKAVILKSEVFKEGWRQVLELLFDEIQENWEDEMWIRIDGEEPDYQFIDPTIFNRVPIKVPNVMSDELGEDPIKTLTEIVEEDGIPVEKEMTRNAQYDFQLAMGNGFPTDKTFVYQSLFDLVKVVTPEGPLVTKKELRDFLRQQVGLPLHEDNDEMPDPMQQPNPMAGPMGIPMPQQPMQMQPLEMSPPDMREAM